MRFSTPIFLFGMTLLVVGAAANPLPAGITYQMLPQAVSKPGWSFDGGYITTDGTIGEITTQNFIDWAVNFTSPFGSHSISRSNGFVTLIIESFIIDLGYYGPEDSPLNLVATDQYFGIPPVERSNRISVLDFTFSSRNLFDESTLPMPRVTFGRSSPGGKDAGLFFDVVQGREINSMLLPGAIENYDTSQQRSASFKYADDGWIAVAVPEPTSFILLCGVVSQLALVRGYASFCSGR